MLDRWLKTIVVLTLLLFLAQAVIGVVARVMADTLSAALSAIGHVGGLLGHLLVNVTVACVAVGILVRGTRLIANRDPRLARERTARGRAVRQRVRRPAEGVAPIENRSEVLGDPDPAVGEEERH